MVGVCLALKNKKGQYSSCAWVLLYNGIMLAYDPAADEAEWVPMWGILYVLTLMEIKSTFGMKNIMPPPQAPRETCTQMEVDTESDSPMDSDE